MECSIIFCVRCGSSLVDVCSWETLDDAIFRCSNCNHETRVSGLTLGRVHAKRSELIDAARDAALHNRNRIARQTFKSMFLDLQEASSNEKTMISTTSQVYMHNVYSREAVGPSIIRLLFLKILQAFSHGFDIEPSLWLTGDITDESLLIIFGEVLRSILASIEALYGVSQAKGGKIMNELAEELLESFISQIEGDNQ